VSKYTQEYYNKNKERIQHHNALYNKNNPTKMIYIHLHDRCTNSKNQAYKYYGGRGIKCFISEEELKELWFRDKAYLMIKPSIDREDNNDNYTYDNCRFIELKENCSKDKRKIILQFDLEGNFIREWISMSDASRKLKIALGDIWRVANNKRKSAGKFVWKYK
jgi:hypothetical protein